MTARGRAPAAVILLGAAIATGWASPGVIEAGELSPAERLGSDVYRRGVGAGGREIVATIGEAGAQVPASALPCAGCHGADGRGAGTAAGVAPADVRWSRLAAADPPYTERLLKRAVTMGLAASGRELDASMPRYQLTLEEAAGLVAYVKRLDALPRTSGESAAAPPAPAAEPSHPAAEPSRQPAPPADPPAPSSVHPDR
jgi:mono/diheme cytochrome c family protein